jgi:hypothetical protein
MWIDRQKDRHEEDNSSFRSFANASGKLGATIFEDNQADKKWKPINVKSHPII